MPTNEELTQERDDWRDLAVKVSMDNDKAVAAVVELSDKLKAPPPGTVLPKPAAAPPPTTLPPPSRPATALAYYNLQSAERARVREFHGQDIEDVLDREFHNANRIGNARVGVARTDNRLSGQIIEDLQAPATKFDSAAYVGRPVSRTIPGVPITAAELMNASIGQGAPRRAAPAPAPAPRGSDGTFRKSVRVR
jgi:hypothetical protein